MKNKFFNWITPFLMLLVYSVAGQEIQIYHGLTGTSTILVDNVQQGTSKKFLFDVGEEITIKIINAHPGLYSYTFNNEEIEITDPEPPDYGDLVNILSSSMATQPNINAAARIINSGGATIPAWDTLYVNKLLTWASAIKEANEIIKISDAPKTLSQALNYSNEGGFMYAQNELHRNNLIFQLQDLQEEAEKWMTEIEKKGYNSQDKQESLKMMLYHSYFKSLITDALTIKKAYSRDVSSTVIYKIKMNTKINKLSISIAPKNSMGKVRERGSNIIIVELQPYYNRPVLEVVPMGLFHKSSGGKTFSISDGVISESEMSEFNFSTGAMLNFNFLNWGARKEYSWGTGIGFAIHKSTFDNFFLNTSLNYRKWIRIGVGYGFINTATGLKNGLKSGDLATEITDLAEVITYERKPALFFTFVIPGLTIPIQ